MGNYKRERKKNRDDKFGSNDHIYKGECLQDNYTREIYTEIEEENKGEINKVMTGRPMTIA